MTKFNFPTSGLTKIWCRTIISTKIRYNINLMPEMEPHETFDGKPAYDIGLEVGDRFPAFEERSQKFLIYDPALFDQINQEASDRTMERSDFLDSCLRVGRVLVAMDPDDRMAVRDGMGFETTINFMDEKYFKSKSLPSDISPTHSFKIKSEGLNILMEQCNKYGAITIEEALERTLRIGVELSQKLGEKGTWIPIYRRGKNKPIKARFFNSPAAKWHK